MRDRLAREGEHDMASDWQELRVSNDALDDPPELRARMDRDGYVFLKGLFNPTTCAHCDAR